MRILEGFTLRKLCGENIVTSESAARIDYSKIISLNETAAYLWNEVREKDFTSDDLVSLLTARYDVDEARARADVEVLLDKWREAGLVE